MQVPVALDQAYSYRVPRGMEVQPGDVVCVPLGPREVVAVVWTENAEPDPRLHNRLKDISDKLDVPPLRDELRALIDWVANYTLSARGMVLRMSLRMGENLGPERMRPGVRLVGEPPRRMTPARRRLIEVLSDGLLRGKSDAAQGSRRQRRRRRWSCRRRHADVEPMPPTAAAPAPDPDFALPDFSRSQRAAVDAMRTLASNGTFHVALLDGVTGSGKTEVYFEAIAGNHPPRQADADPDAGDRADRTIPRPFCRALRRASAGMAFRIDAAHPAAQLGGDMRRARRRSWSARARRCFCPMRISD